MSEQDTNGAPERVTVTDEELARVEADIVGYLAKQVGWGEYEVRLARAAVRLAADLRALRSKHASAERQIAALRSDYGDARLALTAITLAPVAKRADRVRHAQRAEILAVRAALDEVGIASVAGETLLQHVQRLIADANEESKKLEAAEEQLERLKSIATFSPTPEEVSSCAVLAEVAGKPAREAVLYLARQVNDWKGALRITNETCVSALTQARALLQRVRAEMDRIRRTEETGRHEDAREDGDHLGAEIDAFLAGLPTVD